MVKISIILVVIVVIISLVTIYSLSPKLKLDQKEVIINVFDEYNEISYSASSLGKDVTAYVTKEGEVDTEHIGEYKIIYTIKNNFFKTKKQLKVKVIDTISPELNLIGDSEFKVCSLNSYIEPGYSAIDNYDGDITSNVVTNRLNDDNIEYKVSDFSGNISTTNRKLVVEDITAPEIILKGNTTIYITKNREYKDSGAIAIDNCDGDLTNGISIEGSVDTSKTGTYEIKYSVKDSKDNIGEAIRKVVVQEEKKETAKVETSNNSGVIYLTFDDGPGTSTTSILDTLKKYNIKATFFVTLAGSNDILKKEADEGHTIALHTATHDYKKIYASIDDYFEDLNKVFDRVKNVTGIESTFIRFPGGTSNHVSAIGMSNIVNAVNEKGYTYFDWNVSVEDAGECVYKKNKQSCVLKNFKKYLKPNRNNFVLMHDIKSYTANALEDMIKYAISNGYTFKQIDNTTTPVQFKPYR